MVGSTRATGRQRSHKKRKATSTSNSNSEESSEPRAAAAEPAPIIAPGAGFVIECEHNKQRLTVSAPDAKIVLQKSEFFQHAFCHGTTEAASGILSKPDWSLDIARRIVELLVQGTVPLLRDSETDANNSETVMTQFEALRQAADQILCPIHIRHPVHDYDIQHHTATLQLVCDTFLAAYNCDSKRHSSFFMLAGADLSCVERSYDEDDENDNIDPEETEDEDGILHKVKIKVDVWRQFLQQGLLLLDADKKGFALTFGQATATPYNNFSYDNPQTFQVYYNAATPLYVTITHMCAGLRQMRELDSDDDGDDEDDYAHAQKYRLSFQIYCGFYEHCMDLTEATTLNNINNNNNNNNNNKNTNKIPLDVCWEGEFNTDSMADDVALTGGLADLKTALGLVEEFIVPHCRTKKCALFLRNPDWKTIGRTIHATQQCCDHPGTLLWDADGNDFFTIKTLKDTKIILDLLSQEDSPLAKSGDFQLTEMVAYATDSWFGNNWEMIS